VDPWLIIFNLVTFIFSGIFHEQAHARVAGWLGDPTPEADKRLSWDPRHHIDPIMTVVVPLIALISSGGRSLFGMMKPVMIRADNFANPTFGMALSGIAGPISNALLAGAGFGVLAVLLAVAPGHVYDPENLRLTFNGLFICVFIQMNFILGGFNLLPLPGLDGSHVLYHFLPRGGQEFMDRIGPYGLAITMIIVYSIPGLMSSVMMLYYKLLLAAFGPAFFEAALRGLWGA